MLQSLILIIVIVFGGDISSEKLVSILISGGLGPGSYFVWVYVQFSLILPLFYNYTKRLCKWRLMLLLILISAILELICSVFSLPDVIYRLLFFRYIFLIYFGVIIAKEGILINKINMFLSIVSILFILFFCYIDENMEPLFYHTGWKANHWPCYFYVGFLFLWILRSSYDKMKSCLPRIEILVEKIGKNSYEIFLFQMFYFFFLGIICRKYHFHANILAYNSLMIFSPLFCILAAQSLKKFKAILFTLLFVIFGEQYCNAQKVMINEVMQSNVDYLMVDHDFPDSWVELYNNSDEDIDICGWHIGIENDLSSAYIIPSSLIIKSYGHVVVYCDKMGSGVHTDFRIDSGKGNLYLWDKYGVLVDELALKKMPSPNIAYGREYDGSEHWQYEITPTAGSGNNSREAESLLPEPVFSQPGGVYYSPLSVTISIPEDDLPQDTKIYVTLDGKEPDHSSMSGNSFTFDISENTVVRAKLISENAIVPRSTTHSYLFHPRNTTLPVISIVSDDDYFYSNENGILIGGDNDKTTNCYQGWRRPINAEYFDMRNGQETLFNQLCETMVSGNYSRAYPQKSLKLYAHKRWGNKRFYGNFWDDKPGVNKVKSFILRNYGTGCLYGRFHDASIQKVFGIHLNSLDWQAYQPVILYINGKYKGVYEMRERSDEDYVESNYDGLEDIEIYNEEVYWSVSSRKNTLYKHFYDIYTAPEVQFDTICNMMDVDNFLDVLITEMFSTNFDYPHHNISVWRTTAPEGRWRWILKDIDYIGLRKPVTYNMIHYMLQAEDPDSEEYKDVNYSVLIDRSLILYRIMMYFPDIQYQFINRMSVYLGDFLKPSSTLGVLESMDNEIENEIQPTFDSYIDFSKYYGQYEGFEDYDYIDDPYEHYKAAYMSMKEFWRQRPLIIYQQMADFFHLGDVIKLHIDRQDLKLLINGIMLQDRFFEGYWFSGRGLLLDIQSPNYGWEIYVNYTDGTNIVTHSTDSQIQLNLNSFLTSNKVIESVVCIPTYCSSGIKEIKEKGYIKEYFNIGGVKMKSLSNGVNIIKDQDGTYGKVIIK